MKEMEAARQAGKAGAADMQQAAAKGSGAAAAADAQQQEVAPNAVITSVAEGGAAGAPPASTSQQEASLAVTAAMAATAVAAPAGAAGAAEQPDEGIVEIEKSVSVRADQSPLFAALYRVQLVRSGAGLGVGRGGWRAAEVAVLERRTAHPLLHVSLPPLPCPMPQEKATSNVGRYLSLPLELLLLLTWHLAEEVRWRRAVPARPEGGASTGHWG